MIKKINVNNIYYKYIIPHYKYDIALIKWEPKVITPIHDHSKNGCSVYLLSGKLKEDVYKKNKIFYKKNSNYLSKLLDKSYIDNTIGYHKVTNLINKNTWSLHIYEPKGHKTNFNI